MIISDLHKHFLSTNGVCTDTRKIKENTIYFALKGENFDGNTFAKKALESGASYAVVDNSELRDVAGCIYVPDVLQALQQLATYHRSYLGIPILALTGSNGKTTTKELISQVLAKKFKTVATLGNLNNHIGVPLTLLSMTKETEIGVVEMGANHPNEIDFLCNIAQPDYGYITNIGKAHLEGFGDLQGVLQAKTELYRHLKKRNKQIFLNISDTKLTAASENMKRYTFSEDDTADATIQFTAVDPLVAVTYREILIKSNLIGSYNFTNISAAIAIGSYFKIDKEKIKQAIQSYTPVNNRSQCLQKNSHEIILDAYNANPTSMTAALDNFIQLESKSKTLFLGDMLELGKAAGIEHQHIVDKIIPHSFDQLFLFGDNFYKTEASDTRVTKFRRFEDFKKAMEQKKNNFGQLILIKGSRGMKLERILDLI